MVAEVIGGVVSGSLALLADAGHMLVDAAALLFAWLGASFARRPADARRSYGYARLEVLVGYTNALLQVFLVLWISFEAAHRLFDPQPILSGTMLAVAILGLCVNLLVLWVLGHHDHEDVNAAGAYLHVMGDLLGSIAAISAALAVRYFGWLWTDPVVSLVVAVLIMIAAVRLLRRAGHILLEGVPDGIDVDEVARAIEARVPAVRDVHHVHIWQLTGGSRVATLHAILSPGHAADAAIQEVRKALHRGFSIDHVTVQLDGVICARVDCAPVDTDPVGKNPIESAPVESASDPGGGHAHD
jgi:cobalt-zinc-cadmium efflux system protein